MMLMLIVFQTLVELGGNAFFAEQLKEPIGESDDRSEDDGADARQGSKFLAVSVIILTPRTI